MRTVGKAVKSNTGKAIGNAIKEQVNESGTNLAVDALRGNNLSDGINRRITRFIYSWSFDKKIHITSF